MLILSMLLNEYIFIVIPFYLIKLIFLIINNPNVMYFFLFCSININGGFKVNVLFSFKINTDLLKEFKGICNKYQVSYTKMLTLAIKYVVKKDTETENLVLYLTTGSGTNE